MKPRVFILILCCISSAASAADFEASELKSLFTNPQQRARIDAIRSGKHTGSGEQKADKVTVSGYVTRSNGKSVVWLNNGNTLEASRVDGVKVYQSSVGKNKKVTLNADGKTKHLKPGESWRPETGSVVDAISE
jgi:hypothetical protein